jgi:hypothetical protein
MVPALDAAGNMSKKVPRRIRAVKAAAISCVADSLDSFGISDKSILLRSITQRGNTFLPSSYLGQNANL